jgi:hypothetical protein
VTVGVFWDGIRRKTNNKQQAKLTPPDTKTRMAHEAARPKASGMAITGTVRND